MKLLEAVMVMIIIVIILTGGVSIFQMMHYKFDNYFVNQQKQKANLINYSQVLVENTNSYETGYVYLTTGVSYFHTGSNEQGKLSWEYECQKKTGQLIRSQKNWTGIFCSIDYKRDDKIYNFKILD